MASLAVRNNNPGNLKDPKTGSFRTFSSPEEGMQALEQDLSAKMRGATTTGLTSNSSLLDFASKYAPAGDHNDPVKYAHNLAAQLGVDPNTPIGSLQPRVSELARAITHNEDVSNPLAKADAQPLAQHSFDGMDLAQRVKQKYPQYQDVPDDVLTQKVLARYPQYQNLASGASTTQPKGYGYVEPPAPSENNASMDFGGPNSVGAEPDRGLIGGLLHGAGDLLKGITAPVATLLARPVQAGAELLGASPEQVNAASSKVPIYGSNHGLDVPQNGADVKKDVGRGAETVALGLGPVAGGALYGAGNSVEQGNDVFSGKTALQAGIGGATAGALGLAAPILGKVGGAVTPKFAKDLGGAVAEKIAPAAGAVSDFAARTKILPDAASNAINKGAEAVNAIPGKVGAGIANQYGFGAGTTRKDALEAVDKALGETGKKSAGVFANASESKLKGLENMAANADKVTLSDGVPYDPTTASLKQNVEALAQLKNDAYTSWMKNVTDASGSGVTVDTTPTVTELKSILASPGKVQMHPRAAKILSEIEDLKGNPLELQNYIQNLNSGLRGVFSGGTHSIERDVDAQVVKSLNDALDSSVIDTESDVGPIRAAKDLYSSYKAVEDGLVKKAQMAARRAEGGMGGGLYDYVNPFNIADALEFFSNPVGAAKGVLRMGLLAKAKAAKDPEKILQGVFKTIQGYTGSGGQAVEQPVVSNLLKVGGAAALIKNGQQQPSTTGGL